LASEFPHALQTVLTNPWLFFAFIVAFVKTVWLIITGVRLKQKTLGIRQIAKSVIGGLLIASLLFAAALAASPELHEYFHHHHQDPKHNHSCAATLLQHGQIMAGTTPLLVIFVLLFLFCLPLVQPVKFSLPDLRLGFGRAPPRSFDLR